MIHAVRKKTGGKESGEGGGGWAPPIYTRRGMSRSGPAIDNWANGVDLLFGLSCSPRYLPLLNPLSLGQLET